MEKIIIAAMAENRIIGRDNRLPWHIPEELKLFKKTTMGYPMIMGRKTFESFPAPLPGRRHIILSRNSRYIPEGAEKAESLARAIEMCAPAEKVFIIGGEEVFSKAMELTTKILLTVLEREVEGDVSFPDISEDDFRVVSRVHHPDGSEPFTVVTYEKRAAE